MLHKQAMLLEVETGRLPGLATSLVPGERYHLKGIRKVTTGHLEFFHDFCTCTHMHMYMAYLTFSLSYSFCFTEGKKKRKKPLI